MTEQLLAQLDKLALPTVARIGQLHIHLCHHLGRARGEDHHAVGQEQGLLHIVGDHQHRKARLLPQLQDFALHGQARERVELAQRLIQDPQLRLVDQRPRQGRALRHAARELVRVAVGKLAQADQFQRLIHPAVLRNGGAVLPALSSFLLLQGLETLALRMERISRNTAAVLAFLQSHPQVARISHVGLPQHPDHAHARRYLRNGLLPGLLSFELHGGRAAAQPFYDALQLFQRLVNIGDSKSLAAIPAETTHQQLNDEELARAGISPGLVRLSIGIEHPQDLLADLAQALAQINPSSSATAKAAAALHA